MSREIPTKEYMQDGWDSGPYGCHPYKRGSRHNKIGMWIMYIFYGIVLIQVVHAMTVIPFFPITFFILLGLFFICYVAWRAS
jgi:hypothetical protein